MLHFTEYNLQRAFDQLRNPALFGGHTGKTIMSQKRTRAFGVFGLFVRLSVCTRKCGGQMLSPSTGAAKCDHAIIRHRCNLSRSLTEIDNQGRCNTLRRFLFIISDKLFDTTYLGLSERCGHCRDQSDIETFGPTAFDNSVDQFPFDGNSDREEEAADAAQLSALEAAAQKIERAEAELKKEIAKLSDKQNRRHRRRNEMGSFAGTSSGDELAAAGPSPAGSRANSIASEHRTSERGRSSSTASSVDQSTA